jgi:hypothetical protein
VSNLIHRVKIVQVLPDLSTRQLVAFRMAGDQDDVEAFAHLVQTNWLRANPGYATIMIVDWPRTDELGERYVMPVTPEQPLSYLT